jgi:hypothetical protein
VCSITVLVHEIRPYGGLNILNFLVLKLVLEKKKMFDKIFGKHEAKNCLQV